MGAKLNTGGARRGRRSLNAEINVTPFVDVTLVLLIIFMITATALQSGVDVTLPDTAAQQMPRESRSPLTVTVDSEGKVYIDQTEIPFGDLEEKLVAIAREGFEERIVVRGDTNASYGDVIAVLGQIKRANFNNVSLATDPKARPGGTQ